ncbi:MULTISPECIES: ParA family protein [Photobacterium]|uniref:Chromosome partitioning protein ParA n=1 Tax=Photobacterium iliopiscarium TaxID=56192 RepID=A0A2T3M8B7_9GAMM|nr:MULTISPECIES: AAA family ATPase [Photobacterium]MCD9496863.1 AAA family ATPase [Photobacterium carnosum]MCD9500343.1 AAA family ATPase [Photobacterium carnosum]PSV88676.1 chromosome partitioning protein ParA [Photobacterium iliopiscarium]
MNTRIIMIGCRKGGVTKTTMTVNLSYELSLIGKKVLVLDFDGQGDTTKFFGREDSEFYIGDALLDRTFDITKAIYPAIINNLEQDNLHIISGRCGDIMTKLDMNMISLTRREERLKIHLDKIKDKYDYILIDTNPGTSVLGLNAVMAATEFLFPTEYKEHSLDGVETLLEHIQDVKFCEESEIKFMVVPSKISKIAKKALDYGKGYLQGRWPKNTAKTTIWDRSLFTEAEMLHEPASVVKSGHVAARYYKELAKEVIAND